MAVELRFVFGLVLAFVISGKACAGEFTYAIPEGWRDLRSTADHDTSQVPANMAFDAASGGFAVYAFDPSDTTAKKTGATFNAVETPPERLTEAGIDGYCSDLALKMRGAGLKALCVESSLISMNGVEVGTATFDTDSEQAGNRMLLQFIIPGRRASTVLTYAAPKDEYAKYLPTFRASAHATKGGVDQGRRPTSSTSVKASDQSSGYTLGRGVKAFLIGGLALSIPYMLLMLARKRRNDAAAASADGEAAAGGAPARPAIAAPAKKATKYTWMCPSCNNPVPSRLDQCRCGTAKPA